MYAIRNDKTGIYESRARTFRGSIVARKLSSDEKPLPKCLEIGKVDRYDTKSLKGK
jgi:hypothetical protein